MYTRWKKGPHNDKLVFSATPRNRIILKTGRTKKSLLQSLNLARLYQSKSGAM